MVANELTNEDVLSGDRDIAFPASVIDLIGGGMGQPPGGFPQEVKQRVLLGQKEFTGRPGESLPPADFDAATKKVHEVVRRTPESREVVSWLLYERVFEDFSAHQLKYGDVSILPTPNFFYGLEPGEEIAVDIEPGKTLIIRYLTVGNSHADGTRTVFFELNGQPREVTVVDRDLELDVPQAVQADPSKPGHVGASMPGMVVTVAVQPGDTIKTGQKLLSLEAMKMETVINAEVAGTVSEVLVKAGSQVETGDLLVAIEQ